MRRLPKCSARACPPVHGALPGLATITPRPFLNVEPYSGGSLWLQAVAPADPYHQELHTRKELTRAPPRDAWTAAVDPKQTSPAEGVDGNSLVTMRAGLTSCAVTARSQFYRPNLWRSFFTVGPRVNVMLPRPGMRLA